MRQKRRPRASKPAAFRVESLECRRLLAGDDGFVDPLPPEQEMGVVSGRKWQDDNANGVYDGGEQGLGGVTIYADLNHNGSLDRSEPWTKTDRDLPETDFDEGGLYTLQVPSGAQVIREVVPNGYHQTFPTRFVDFDVEPPVDDEPLAHVEPPQLALPAIPGETFHEVVEIVINPVCIRAHEIDVVASDPNVNVENLSGVQLNGCGGDVSHFELAITMNRPQPFELQFVDILGGSVLGTIPVWVDGDVIGDGGHHVWVEPGGGIDGIDFGNALILGGAVEGATWLDSDGNGMRDDGEPGIAGVTVYADLNNNGRLDRREPKAVTQHDVASTDVDETGWYRLSGLEPGEHTIREVVPRHHVQTFPGIGARVISSETGRMADGVALDLDVTDVRASVAGDAAVALLSAQLDVTVVWPDSCGTLIDSKIHSTVVGDQIVVDLAGHQVGEVCAEVISPQVATLDFEGLAPGRYHVVTVLHETLRDGNESPTLTAVGTVAIGGPGAHHVTVKDAEIVSGIDFGNQSTLKPGAVTGLKWNDLNGDGRRDANEPGLAGVTIYIDVNYNGQFDPGEPSAVTAEDDPSTERNELGRYTISVSQTERSFAVREVVPDGYHQTFPSPWIWLETVDHDLDFLPPPGDVGIDLPWGWSDRHHDVFVPSGEVVEQVDFGNQRTQPGAIEGTKWLDGNSNGHRDEGEAGLAGVTIYLDTNFNGLRDDGERSTVTDETGYYSFTDLQPNRYQVAEVIPDGYLQTFPTAWPPLPFDVPWDWPRLFGPNGRDDVFPTEPFYPIGGPVGMHHFVTVSSGETVSGIDFGNAEIRPGSIEGLKWLDRNGDGRRDDTEPGVGGVTIFLDANFNGQHEPDELSVVTDDDGRYAFRDLPSQSYLVLEQVPAGMQQTFPRDIFWFAPIDIHREAYGGHHVWVGNGESIVGIDFGNRPLPVPSYVAGTQWLDSNGDGHRNDDEPGLAGITVYADLNNNGWIDRGEPLTETDELGHYRLAVQPGEFVVRELLPPGYVATSPSESSAVIHVDAVEVNPGTALAFDLVDVRHRVADEVGLLAELTFEVTWRNGCGQLAPELAVIDTDGHNLIRAEIVGHVFDGICTQAIREQQLTVDVPVMELGHLLVEASLVETTDLQTRPDVPTFLLSANVDLFGELSVGHLVHVEAGDVIEGIDFGSRWIGDEGTPPVDPMADMDRDGRLSANDIDALAAAIRGRESEPGTHDLTGDGVVDEVDLEYLVHDVMRVRFGDANTDGVFDSADLVQVFKSGEFEDGAPGNSTWATGDWNGDGEFSSADLVSALKDGYQV